MALHVNQQRAVALFALGHGTNDIAKQLDISRQTLCRWQNLPEFEQTLNKTVGENMAGMRVQVQLTAQTFVEGGLEAGQQLRHMILKANTTDTERRLSSMTLLRHTTRFWDLMGFNAKLPNPASLLNDKLPDLQESDAVEKVSFHPNDRKPGDRAERPGTEEDGVPPGSCALSQPDYVHDWQSNPVNDDGTPKKAPEPREYTLPEFKDYDPTRSIKSQVEEATAECVKRAEAAAEARITVQPASYKPKPKPWKRSATTTRCQPTKTSSPRCPTTSTAQTTNASPSPNPNPNPNPTHSQTSKTKATPPAAHGPG